MLLSQSCCLPGASRKELPAGAGSGYRKLFYFFLAAFGAHIEPGIFRLDW